MKRRTQGSTSLRIQCGSSASRTINAPLDLVWSLVRQFDRPQAYKQFVRKCIMQQGHGAVGSVREVIIVSGLSDTTCIERLDELDDEMHLMQFSIIGGDNRLKNYRSTVVLREMNPGGCTEITESYQVDVPMDSNEKDTCVFADTIIAFNLMSLATVVEKLSLS